MKFSFAIACLFLLPLFSFAQFNFKCDPYVTKNTDFIPDSIPKPHSDTSALIDSVFRLEKDYEFQFRFWVSGMFTPSTEVFMMTRRNQTWSARYFGPNKNWRKDGKILAEVAVDQTKLNQLWNLLMSQNVLGLVSEEEIKTPTVEYTIDTSYLMAVSPKRFDMVDGGRYEFEMVKGSTSRYYSYACPRYYITRFKNILEYYNAAMIILIINKYLGTNRGGC